MNLTSPAFEHKGKIPSLYTCDGQNISPPLAIANVPAKAQSLVLIMDDPDVPRHLRKDGMWDHWVVFNIPAKTREIVQGQEPKGTAGSGTAGNRQYYGPCPPDREHRYFFKLYALNTVLALKEGASKKDVEAAMQDHILEQVELVGRFKKA